MHCMNMVSEYYYLYIITGRTTSYSRRCQSARAHFCRERKTSAVPWKKSTDIRLSTTYCHCQISERRLQAWCLNMIKTQAHKASRWASLCSQYKMYWCSHNNNNKKKTRTWFYHPAQIVVPFFAFQVGQRSNVSGLIVLPYLLKLV